MTARTRSRAPRGEFKPRSAHRVVADSRWTATHRGGAALSVCRGVDSESVCWLGLFASRRDAVLIWSRSFHPRSGLLTRARDGDVLSAHRARRAAIYSRCGEARTASPLLFTLEDFSAIRLKTIRIWASRAISMLPVGNTHACGEQAGARSRLRGMGRGDHQLVDA